MSTSAPTEANDERAFEHQTQTNTHKKTAPNFSGTALYFSGIPVSLFAWLSRFCFFIALRAEAAEDRFDSFFCDIFR